MSLASILSVLLLYKSMRLTKEISLERIKDIQFQLMFIDEIHKTKAIVPVASNPTGMLFLGTSGIAKTAD